MGNDADCTIFNPGLAIPQGDNIVCTNLVSATHACTITGVLTNK